MNGTGLEAHISWEDRTADASVCPSSNNIRFHKLWFFAYSHEIFRTLAMVRYKLGGKRGTQFAE